ncbi:glutamate racemase [Psychrobacter aestuarii]|uniref:Glutamate racemase n=1 Tax=Psychrobacter aestuarii TaxID=556327 RepID=A0ABN0VT58_9GAMM|nr:glutamate racemase [Psychrobacter aestuarii]
MTAPTLSPLVDTPAVTQAPAPHAPIGLFDSGVGGLSVYQHLAKALPAERYIYYADTLHVPYGSRDGKDIENLTLRAVDWLYRRGCKLVVMACNSASAHALDTARALYPQLPIVGLVPALKPAVRASRTKRVAVLATKATLNGALLAQVIDTVATPAGVTVVKYFDPLLVPWVEAGMPEEDPTATRLREQLKTFDSLGIDSLILGCTHYPFFKNFLYHEIDKAGLTMQVLDSGQAIAARVQHLLAERGLLAPNQDVPLSGHVLAFYASRYDDGLLQVVERLLESSVPIAVLGAHAE